jgi:cytochrome c oxidase subunit 2
MLAFGAPAAAHPTVDIVAANWHFTPSTVTVDAGQSTTLRLTSTSGTHGIASDELGIPATMISPGKFVEVSFTPRTAGTYAVHCSIFCGAGHADMVLTVIVASAAMSTPAPTAIPQPAVNPSPMPASTPTPTPKPTPKPLIDDRHYIILMVAHDRMGLQIAQLAVKRSLHPEIRTLARSLVTRNTAAIVQLKRWYNAWYGSSVPAMPSMMSTSHAAMPMMGPQSMPQMFMDMMRSMSPESLGSAPDFDRALLIGAIHHDSMGASMSLGAETGLTHPELRRFARSAAASQLNEVQQLWRWYNQWYPEK